MPNPNQRVKRATRKSPHVPPALRRRSWRRLLPASFADWSESPACQALAALVIMFLIVVATVLGLISMTAANRGGLPGAANRTPDEQQQHPELAALDKLLRAAPPPAGV